MKIVNELLGFAVLTSPLWLILLIATIALLAVVFLVRRTKGRSRIVLGLLAFIVLVSLPFADEIVGRMYLSHLCTTEVGVKVYKTVELPASYWDEEGKPKFLSAYGLVDMKLLPNRFEWHDVRERHVDAVIKIDKWRWQLRDQSTQEVLGERITFLRYFGWIRGLSPAPNIGRSCRDLGEEFSREEGEREQTLLRSVLGAEAVSR